MIDWLEIKQFAIADHIEIEFDGSFTTVTGETGSGKSLIIDAIDILLGHRSDNSYIRHNQDTAELQAGFDLPTKHPALNWLQQHGLDNDSECILRRVIRRDKASKGYINGHAATASQLRELGSELVDIHGQNEHHSLLKRAVQLNLLDHAANNIEAVEKLADCYRSVSDIQKQIDNLNNQSHAAQERADLLKFQIEELNELSPIIDEWPELENQHKKLNHQQELSSGTQYVAQKLFESDTDSLSSQLIACSMQLDQLSEFDESLKPIVIMLNEAQVNAEEAANQLRQFYEQNESNPEEAQRIEHRFSLYHNLARKHRMLPQLLADHLAQMQQELSGLKDPEKELKRLQDLFEVEYSNYQNIAQSVSSRRKLSGKRLSKEVTTLMQELGMEGGAFEIQISPLQPGSFTRYGNETAEFLVSANPGQPLQAMSKVASGGELSRISLAIQVILANKAQVPTLIFDEVDVGIGGKVANVVGQKLKELGESNQVICVTHLSQVAAKGDQQFNVSKQGSTKDGEQVSARVEKLSMQQRIEEIARMTGGETLTEQSLAHAQEMLKSA